MPTIVEDFEDGTYAFPITGTWVRTNAQRYAGSWSLRSKAGLDPDDVSDAVVTVPAGTTSMSFRYKVSSEENYDLLRVYLGDEEEAEFEASGEVGWLNRTINVTGVTTVTFRYSKDPTGDTGDDAAYIDNLSFVISDSVAPTVPDNLRTTLVTGTQVDVAWDASTDDNAVTGYGLYLNGTKVGADQTGLTKSFTALTAGLTYTLEVDARDLAGNRSAKASIEVLAVTDLEPPSDPPNVTVTEVTHSTVTLTWDSSTDDVALAGYGIYLDGALVDEQTALTVTFTDLARGASYELGVDAVDTTGHRSAIVTVDVTTLEDTLPSAPPGLTATAGQEDITLAWGASTDDLGIARYEVLLDGEVLTATGALTLGHVIEELEPGTTYHVGVQAVDDGGGRGPAVSATVTTLAAGWAPIDSPVYRVGEWAGNVRDEHGVDWVVQGEQGWSSTPETLPLEADLDGGDGGFSGPGTFGQRRVVLEGVAIAPTRVGMLAAQERLAGVLHPGAVATLRVVEAHLTRQAQVRLHDQVEITDRTAQVFEWVLTVAAGNPRRQAVRGIYREAEIGSLPGQASLTVDLAGDYPTIPAQLRVWGPIKNFLITHEESGLVIRSKPGTVLPADSRYSVSVDLATRRVLAFVPPDVWPEPRPGRTLLAVLPTRFMLRPGPNTLTLSGEAVDGAVGKPRMVAEAIDSWM